MATPEGNVIKKRPHTYTATEKTAISDGIADCLDAGEELARDKKMKMAEYKSLEEELNDKLQTLRSNKKQGYEVREYLCAVIRNRDTQTVDYVDVDSGDVIATEPFTPADWEVVLSKSQLGLFPTAAPDEKEMQRDPMPTLYPDFDDHGTPMAGPKTDLYNQTYPNSPYKHLSEHIDFTPAMPSTDVADFLATLAPDVQAKYQEIIASFEHFTLEELNTTLAAYQNPPVAIAEGSDEQKMQHIIIDNLNTRILAALKGEADEPEAPAGDDGGHRVGEVTNGTGDVIGGVHIGPPSEDDDEPQDDEPQPDKPKRTPKRPAKRK